MTLGKRSVLPERRATVAGGQREKADEVTGIDGRRYNRRVEDELNRLAHLVFDGDNGRRLLDYLRSITLNSPFDADVSDGRLRHMEGQRFIVGVLVNRAREGARQP